MSATRPQDAKSFSGSDNPMHQSKAAPPAAPEKSPNRDLSLHRIHKTLFEELATEGEGHYLVAVGASNEFANGIYRRMPEEDLSKEGNAVYASGAGFTITREIISGDPGYILGFPPDDALYGVQSDAPQPPAEGWIVLGSDEGDGAGMAPGDDAPVVKPLEHDKSLILWGWLHKRKLVEKGGGGGGGGGDDDDGGGGGGGGGGGDEPDDDGDGDGALVSATGRLLHASRLASVDLSFCERVGDAGVRALAACCPLLTRVNLCDCRGLTDAGVESLVRRCKRLESLSLELCTKVTDVGPSSR